MLRLLLRECGGSPPLRGDNLCPVAVPIWQAPGDGGTPTGSDGPGMIQQTDPIQFFGHLVWLDGRPLLDVVEPYRQTILRQGLFTFRPDGSLLYKRVLCGRAKKNGKTTDAVLAALYRLLVWKSAGGRGEQVYFLASDLGQANDALELCKKIIRCNPLLAAELFVKANRIERRDGDGFMEILPAQNAQGLHGKTYSFRVISECHTHKNYDVFEALELDRTRPDAIQWNESYASLYRHAGVPLVDMLKQHEAQTDPRLYVSWYSGTVEEANPSLHGPLGPTMEDIEDARRSLPSWIFRRLYLNLPGQPDGAAFDADVIESAVIAGCKVLKPQDGIQYVAFTDFGAGGPDDSTLAIAHADTQGRVILDCLIDQGARTDKTYSPEQAVKKFVDVLTLYRCSTVTGDNFSKRWPQDAFTKLAIEYVVSDKNRSDIYASFEPLLNGGLVQLLDIPTLTQQLIGLIRKGVKIDHPTGEHDDHANAAAGAVVLAKGPTKTPGVFVFHSSSERARMPDEHLFTRIQ